MTICPVDDLGTVWAVDVTVRGRHASRGAENAEKKKMRYYNRYFFGRKGTVFYPFALTLEGEGGPSAKKLCAKLALAIKRSPASGMSVPGAWRYIVARLANGFASGVGGQIVQYEKLVNRVVNGRKVNGSQGYNGRRPQKFQQRDMIDGQYIYDL